MNAIRAYLQGWKWSVRNIKLWFWLYLFNVVLAALAALPLMNVLEEKLGRSMVSDSLMEGFDYTVFTDFMNQYGVAIAPILSQSKLLIFLYFLLSIWLMGGILNSVKNSLQKAHFQSFIVGCIKYFWRILFLTILFLFLHGIVAFGVFSLFKNFVHGFDFKQLSSELELYRGAAIWGFIYSLFLVFFFQIQDYAKVFLVKNDSKVHQAIGQSVRFIFRNFGSTFLLTLINWLTFILVVWLYWVLSGDDLNSTEGTLRMTFVLGQIFVLFRLGLKVVNLESAMLLTRQLNQ